MWDEKQVRELVESVFNGYPVGSVLLWQTTDTRLAVDTRFPFPTSPRKTGSVNFVLDGMQRLTTLYNCFYPIDSKESAKFRVAFDLERETFRHWKSPPEPHELRLDQLFSPKDFLAWQQRLGLLAKANEYLDTAVRLHTAFQEYLIPVVTLKERPLASVVEIFERVNNTGTRFGSVDFMRAVTWKEDFDLSTQIAALNDRIEETGYVLPDETVVKVLAICSGKNPALASMLELRNEAKSELEDGLYRAEATIRRSIDFLKNQLQLLSYDFLPYEAQFLALAHVFATNQSISPSASQLLAGWIRGTSASEDLQGRSDSSISALIENIQTELAKPSSVFVSNKIGPDEIQGRRFIAGRALSCALAMAFAARGARDPTTGAEIQIDKYMQKFDPRAYVPVFSLSDLRAAKVETDTARLVANIVVFGDEKVRKSARRELSSQTDVEVLASQFLSQECIAAIRADDPQAFLAKRALLLAEALSE